MDHLIKNKMDTHPFDVILKSAINTGKAQEINFVTTKLLMKIL